MADDGQRTAGGKCCCGGGGGGGGLMLERGRKVILRTQASSRQARKPRFHPGKSDTSDAMATHNSLLGGLDNDTETRGELFFSPFFWFLKKPEASSSDCGEYLSQRKLQSRSKRLSLLTNLARGGLGRGGRGGIGARSEEKHIQMFN